jgi:hypothetical protein
VSVRILLSRDYDRIDHLRSICEATRGSELSLLYRKYPDAQSTSVDAKILYWSEFATPYEILDRVRPDKIVFTDIETFYEVALNIAARRAGIPTFVYEHGLRYAGEVQVAYDAGNPASVALSGFASRRGIVQRLHTLRFYLSALRDCTTSERVTLLRFLYRRSVDDMTVALSESQFDLRLADAYINYSVENTAFLRQRDGMALSRFRLIGNPSLDEYFDETLDASHVPKEDFYLLIDSPLVEVESIAMPGREKAAFLEKLSAFAKRKGAKLYVKLHPYSYLYGFAADYLPKDENIIYGRDVPVGPLLRRARGCFGLVSTLMTVAPCLNRCIVFRLPNQPFPDDLVARGVAGGLDFHHFLPEDISFDGAAAAPEALARFVDDYLYKADGKATERLRALLMT